jgi:hypothetical protein
LGAAQLLPSCSYCVNFSGACDFKRGGKRWGTEDSAETNEAVVCGGAKGYFDSDEEVLGRAEKGEG